jgi:hypothetical protein
MKISFDTDDNNLLLDIKAGVFIALLQTEIKDSLDNIKGAYHPDDVKQSKKVIKACKVLLDYYGGEHGD